LCYVHGVTSKDLFESLPKYPDDQQKLYKARSEAVAAMEGGGFATVASYSICEKAFGNLDSSSVTANEEINKEDHFPTYDEIFPDGIINDVPQSNLFLTHGEIRIQKGKAEECARGLEATMGKYYRSFPGVHWYSIGISNEDPNKLLMCGCLGILRNPPSQRGRPRKA
jgi:hypothetical protein